MNLTPAQMDQMIDEHFGYECRDDVEGVLKTLTDDARHDIVGFPTGPTRGRESAREFYQTMFADLSDSRVTNLKRLYGDNFLIDESLWEGKAPGQPFGFEGKGRPLSFRLLHVIEFSHQGEIASEQVWCDMLAIAEQLK